MKSPFQTSLLKKTKEFCCRLMKFFFRNKKNFFNEQLLFSFLGIVKQKKIRSDSKLFEILALVGKSCVQVDKIFLDRKGSRRGRVFSPCWDEDTSRPLSELLAQAASR